MDPHGPEQAGFPPGSELCTYGEPWGQASLSVSPITNGLSCIFMERRSDELDVCLGHVSARRSNGPNEVRALGRRHGTADVSTLRISGRQYAGVVSLQGSLSIRRQRRPGSVKVDEPRNTTAGGLAKR